MTQAAGPKSAFVTGATGFVGLNLVEALIAAGWQVTAMHRPSSKVGPLRAFPVQAVVAGLGDATAVEHAMPSGVDAVFHVAGDLNMWSRRNAQQTATNVGGTENVVEAALRKGAKRFVLTSTISAYGTPSGPVSERTPSTAATSWINYERSKWQSEEVVRRAHERGLAAVIINPCAVLGPRDLHGWAQLFFMIRDGKVKGLPPGSATFNHVTEVARAHIAAAERGRTGENYILPGAEATFADLMRMMAARMGVPLNAKVAPPVMLKLMGHVAAGVAALTGKPPDISPEMAAMLCMQLHCETDKAERELGYRAVPVQKGVDDSYAWLVAEGLL